MATEKEQADPRRSPSIAVVIVLALVASSLFQGSRGLYEPTEGRCAECARETLISGHLDDPILNGANHWSKPPLTYLAIMAGLKTLGQNEWGVRAYLIVCFTLTVAAVYWGGSSLFNKETGYYASLVYGSSIFPLLSSNAVSADALLTMWEAIAIACFWYGMRSGKSCYLLWMWFFFGLEFLTKGPSSFLPLFGIVPAYWVLKRTTRPLPGLFSPVGLMVFLLVGLSRFLWEGLHHPGLWGYWLKHELIGRNVTAEAHRNPQCYMGVAMYLPILALGNLPWPILMLSKQRPSLRFAPLGRIQWRNCLHALSPEWIFILGMIFVSLPVLLTIKSKLPLYVLPLFIPVSIAYGQRLQHLACIGALRQISMLRVAFLVVVVFVAGKAFSARADLPSDMKSLSLRVAELEALYPDHKLVVYRRPLNGLEFYLDRLLPVLPMGPNHAVAIRAFAVETPLLVLAKQKYAARILKALDTEKAQIVPTGKKGWIAVVVEKQER